MFHVILTKEDIKTFQESLEYMDEAAPAEGEGLECRIESAELALKSAVEILSDSDDTYDNALGQTRN